MSDNHNWHNFSHVLPEDVEILTNLARSNEWLRAVLHTLARRGTAFRQRYPERAFELLQILAPFPFYKAGQFLFDLLEWEDFIVDGSSPRPRSEVFDTGSLRAVGSVLRGLRGYVDGALPREMNMFNGFDPMDFVMSEGDLPPLQPGFYLYQDIVLGLLRTVVQRQSICLTIYPTHLEGDLLPLPCVSGNFEVTAPDVQNLRCIVDEASGTVRLLIPVGGIRVALPGAAWLVVVRILHTQKGSIIIRAYSADRQLLLERAVQAGDAVQEIVMDVPAVSLMLRGDVPAELHGVCVYRFPV